jgi:hypothetical protein
MDANRGPCVTGSSQNGFQENCIQRANAGEFYARCRYEALFTPPKGELGRDVQPNSEPTLKELGVTKDGKHLRENPMRKPQVKPLV